MPDMQDVIRDLQETLTVMAEIQRRQAAALKDHAEWLVAHDQAIVEMREHERRIDARIEKLGERIDSLVSAIGEMLRKPEGGR
jgi:hypothetical protein